MINKNPQILGVSGSPIKNSNTDRLVKAVLDASGLASEFVKLSKIQVRPCIACLGCKADNVCKVQDGFPDRGFPGCPGGPGAPHRIPQGHSFFLSNGSAQMWLRQWQAPGVEGVFTQVISADEAKIFKPSPRVYALAPQKLELEGTNCWTGGVKKGQALAMALKKRDTLSAA